MKLAKRVQNLPPYLFVGISKAIAKKKEEGIEVISFGIGDPDIPTPNTVLDRLKKASDNRVHHRYPESEGLPEFRQAVSKFYKDRFNVNLNYETEIINLNLEKLKDKNIVKILGKPLLSYPCTVSYTHLTLPTKRIV